MKRFSIFAAVLVFLSLSFANIAPQSANDLFQKALAKERAEGNLEEAIALYQRVVKEAKDESLAAKAQLRIGICYEKLGKEKAKLAQESFQKVIDDYPNQIETVKVAREKLSGLLKAQAPIEKGNGGLRVRQLLSGPELLYDGWLGDVSPDGRYVSIVDWETGDLAIRDLITGKKQRLTDQKNEKGYALFSRWSPDGKKIVYDWWEGKSFVDLRIIGIEEKNLRSVYKSGEIEYVWPLDWFPDGEHILTAMSVDGIKNQIAVISIKNSTTQIIRKELEGNSACLSPDGRYIAYHSPKEESIPERDIFLYSIEEEKEIPLIEHPANDEILGWSPDGRWIFFQSSRLGSNDAWIVQISNGKVDGKPQLVKKGIEGIGSLGFSQDGAFYYMYSKNMEDIFTASLNPENGKVQKPAEKINLPAEGRNDFPAYSPDGKKLAYIRNSLGSWLNQSTLHLLSLDTGKEQVFPLGMRVLYPCWSPDGSTILVTGNTERRLNGICRINVQTGDVKSVLFPQPSKKERYCHNEWTPDGKSFYFIQEKLGDEYSCQIYKYNFETEKKERIYQTSSNITISLSPDGRWLAFIGREAKRELKIIPIEGGKPRVLCRFNQGGYAPILLAWTPDSQYILFFKKKETDVLGQELCRVPISGGDLQELGLSMIDPDHLSVHPDGQKIVFSSLGFSIPYPEYWVMENFLPKLKSKRQDD
jgi:Tol biopolymer transport system component